MATVKWDRTQGVPEPIRLLNRIEESENGESLVDIRRIAPAIRIHREQVIPYVRQTVAEMCAAAAQKLPNGYYLTLVEGWRPIERQQRIWDFVWKCAEDAYPHRDYTALRRTVCRWVAPTDQQAPPGHCTGAAVDVWLVDEDGKQLDVCSPFDRFHSAPTYCIGLSDVAHRNRHILVDAMLSVGFSNCRDEWWHYSFGDAGWAVRTHAAVCPYGLARLPESLYAELEALHVIAMQKRPNPFTTGQ